MKVFVYGSLKRGFGNHVVLGDSPMLGEAMTASPSWQMLDLGAFPAVVQGQGHIHGEVYEVNEDVFQSLDYLEGYPSFYDRHEVEVIVQGEPRPMRAWMYTLVDRHGYEVPMEEGVWGA